MTNQEAIKTLYEYRHCFWDKLYEPICMAIKALEQEPSGDLISRQAVLDLVVTNHTELNGVNVVMYSPLCKDIKQLPPVNPQEQKTGHWIWCVGSHKCSNCEEYTCFSHKLRYCPNCGARMESEE